MLSQFSIVYNASRLVIYMLWTSKMESVLQKLQKQSCSLPERHGLCEALIDLKFNWGLYAFFGIGFLYQEKHYKFHPFQVSQNVMCSEEDSACRIFLSM